MSTTYSDDDRERDAAMLDSLEGVVRADTKRILTRVANDDEVSVALLRLMALKAGATLDCFFKINRKKHRAVPLTDKHMIVQQLMRPKGMVRLAAAERMGRESLVSGKKTQRRVKTQKQAGGMFTTPAASPTPSSTPSTPPASSTPSSSFGQNMLVTTFVEIILPPMLKSVGVDELSPDMKNRITAVLTAIVAMTVMNSSTQQSSAPAASPNTGKAAAASTGSDVEQVVSRYLQMEEPSDKADGERLDNKADIDNFTKYWTDTLKRDRREINHAQWRKINNLLSAHAWKEASKVQQETILEKEKKKQEDADEAQLDKIKGWIPTFSLGTGIDTRLPSKDIIAAGISSFSKIFPNQGQVLTYSFYTAIIAVVGAILYYLANEEYDDDDEYDDDSNFDPETDPEVQRTHAHPFVQLAQRGKEMRSKLIAYFRKHPIFTLGFTTASLFTAYAYRKHTANKQIAQLLMGLAETSPDRVHLTSYSGETYADTDECLRSVDPALHEVFLRYDSRDTSHALAKVYYHVIHAQHKRQKAILVSDRAVLNAHLIRTDGELRDSVGEIARAIAYHWKASNLLSIGWTQAKRTFRMLSGRYSRRQSRPSTRRRSSSTSSAATKKKKR